VDASSALEDASREQDSAPPGATPDASQAVTDTGMLPSARDGSVAVDDASPPGNVQPAMGVPTLFWLDATQGRVVRGDPETRTSKAIVTRGSATPDGIAVDPRGSVYWTNMGVPQANDGFILRADLDGANVRNVVPVAATFTPKQLELDVASGVLYWSDREGMQVLRVHSDGSGIETLVTTASGDSARSDAANWAVGIAVDVPGNKLYWTQKGPDNGGQGSIRRAGLTLPPGETASRRSDIEVLFAGLPEPIDLELDLAQRQIYWTDRGDNTVSRAPLEPPPGVAANARKDRQVLVRAAGEAIGIALDLAQGYMYYTALEGTVSRARLDGSEAVALFRNQGALTGIAYVALPR
jgi:sugar lactone lactonase YvrE